MPDNLRIVHIAHTNDLHSRFEQMPKIATLLRRFRQESDGAGFIAVDCGDHMDRARLETEGTLGAANVEVMNAAGYDLAVPGNNEGLTLTPSQLAAIYEGARFKVVCGNLRDAATGAVPAWLTPHSIIRSGGLRIGFIAATAYYPKFYTLLGWEVLDPFLSVRNTAALLRKQSDILVLLSHLGLPSDERIAAEIPGIDLILGAHTHHLLEEPLIVGETAICAAGKFGGHVGIVQIAYDAGEGRLHRISGRCVPCEGADSDPETEEIIARSTRESQERLGEPIASLDEPLSIEWEEESPLGHLMAAGLRSWTGAQIGLVNAGQALESLMPGTVTRETLHRMCPSPVNPCLVRLKGRDILQALEESLLPEFFLRPIRGYGFRGVVLGRLCVDGLRVEYDTAAPPYAKIRRVYNDDREMEPEEEYLVGTVDMFTFNIGYPALARGRDTRYFLPDFLRDVLSVQLTRPERILESRKARNWIAIGAEAAYPETEQ